jgi:pilus assembly protein Flp/PilA
MITPESVIDANHQNQGEMEMNVLKQLFVDEQGASMAEYALLLALIAVATIGALQVLQGQIVGVFDRVGTAINGALPTGP